MWSYSLSSILNATYKSIQFIHSRVRITLLQPQLSCKDILVSEPLWHGPRLDGRYNYLKNNHCKGSDRVASSPKQQLDTAINTTINHRGKLQIPLTIIWKIGATLGSLVDDVMTTRGEPARAVEQRVSTEQSTPLLDCDCNICNNKQSSKAITRRVVFVC